MSDEGSFREQLALVLEKNLAGCRGLRSVERLSGGASQETHRLEIDTAEGPRLLALRRAPGGASGAAGVPGRVSPAGEAALFEAARAAGVPEPEIHYVLVPADGLGEGFVMEWLEGETLGARIVRAPELDAVRPRLAYQCGQILAHIHGIDVAAHGLDAFLAQVETESFVRLMWEQYRACDSPQPMIDYTARWLLDHLPGDVEPALVHNDFRNGNLVVGPDGIRGVLDWELAHVGDPMRDLGWICTNSWRFGRRDLPVGGFGHRGDLFLGYESVAGVAVDPERVRFWEVFGSFWWAVVCLGMAASWRSGADPSVERPAIGRRSSESQVDCVNLLIPGPVELVAAREPPSTDLPRIDELLASARDLLRGDVTASTRGRTRFLARVAANSLDVALRELAVGPELRRRERERLARLLGAEGTLPELRVALVRALRDASLPLDAPGLAEHLRATVVNQVAVDQPSYSGLEAALDPSAGNESREDERGAKP